MRAARHVAWPAGLILVVLIVPVVRGHPASTYGGAQSWLLWSQVCAALALLAAGTLVADTSGRVALQLAGVLWLVPELAGWWSGPAELRTVADTAARLLPALAVVGVVQASATRGRWAPLVTVLALCGGLLAANVRLFLLDPFLDARCWRLCDHNALVVAPAVETGRWLERGGVALTAVAAAAAVTALLADAFRRGPRRWVPGAAAAGALVVGLVVPSALRLGVAESPTSQPYLVLFSVAQLGAVGLLTALVGVRLGDWRLGVRLTRLATGLRASPAPGSLAAALGRAVGDPHLEIVYWAPERGGYVDAGGDAVGAPAPDGRRRVTPVARRRQRLAALVHSAEIDGDRLNRALGPALRLSLENERLRAATLAELGELRSSRARIVERAADERRRLERNLHDGVQQRVVSLSVLLRMLRNRAPDETASALAVRAEALTKAMLEELRRVARGIYPAVLADAGLAGAVGDLAESSTDVAVQVSEIPRGRYNGTVETTAYLVVAAAVADARSRSATHLRVSAMEQDSMIVVDLDDDGPPGPGHSFATLADQVGALAGRLFVEPGPHGTHVRLELPCVS